MAATVNAVALLAAPFPSHEGHGVAGGPHGFPILASVGLYVLVVLAGTLAAPALSRSRTNGRLRYAVVGGLAFGYAGLVVAQVVRHELSSLAAAGVLTAIVVALLALRRDAYAEQVVAAAVLLAAQVPVVGTEAGDTHLFAVLAHLVAASVWIGGVLQVILVTATAGRADGAGAARRFSIFAVPSTAFLVGSGVVLMLVHHIGRVVLTSSAYGHVLLAKMALLALAVAVGFTMRRRATAQPGRWWPRLARLEALALASALAFGALLVGLADPEPAVTLTAPGLAHVRMGDESGTFFLVSRDRTSAWLQYVAGDDDAPAVHISDGNRKWDPSNEGDEATTVALRDGRARLTVAYEEKTLHVTLPATRLPGLSPDDPATADLAGKLEYALGRSLATAASPDADRVNVAARCAATPTAAEQGVALARTLRALDVHKVRVIGDDSARAHGFEAGMRSALDVTGSARTLVLAGDADSALHALTHDGARATGGIYLAPWLLSTDVLSATRQRALPQLAVASLVDPMAPLADRYRGLLSTLATRAQPTAAGLLGFLSVAAPAQLQQSLRVYAATPVGFLPGILDVGHTHQADGWFANGTLAPISAAQPVASTATPCRQSI